LRAIGILNRSRKLRILLVKYKFIFDKASSSASLLSLLELPTGVIVTFLLVCRLVMDMACHYQDYMPDILMEIYNFTLWKVLAQMP